MTMSDDNQMDEWITGLEEDRLKAHDRAHQKQMRKKQDKVKN
jgi:hypothetical protein